MQFVVVSAVVIPVHLTCNMHDLTMDEILNKMKKVQMQVIDIAKEDCRGIGLPAGSLGALEELKALYHEKDATWFNDAGVVQIHQRFILIADCLQELLFLIID